MYIYSYIYVYMDILSCVYSHTYHGIHHYTGFWEMVLYHLFVTKIYIRFYKEVQILP